MTNHLLNFDPRILSNLTIKLHNILNNKMHEQYAYQQNMMMMNQQTMNQQPNQQTNPQNSNNNNYLYQSNYAYNTNGNNMNPMDQMSNNDHGI